jgi:hypothetical protein
MIERYLLGEKSGNMRGIIVFCVFALTITSVCCAQNNQTESITFTTYFSSPGGVYKNFQLSPSGKPDMSGPESAGLMYYNETEQAPYIYNGTEWIKIGPGSSSGFRVVSVFGISPDQCSGTKSAGTYPDQLCDGLWYTDITFQKPFQKKPDVLVVLQEVPDMVNSPCAENITDQYIGFPTDINETGFRMWAGGSPNQSYSPPDSSCGWNYREWHTRAVAGYYAAGE